MTARLHMAFTILKAAGAESTRTHSDRTYVEYGRERHMCDHHCTTAWPEWVTGEMFDQAFTLADTAIPARSTYNRRHFGV